jgi:UDP-N-acetylmuramate: L-alanyl-gamma-D-glutamyl-meso-diaminopimelate ligase
VKNIHFIAIGGAVMHQLALALQRAGNTVTGSDDDIADPAKSNLEAVGLLPAELGWHPGRITKEVDAVVLGMHAKDGNPELARAQELGISVYSFPEYVYEVSRDKHRVVIAGSHGKTTITSMIMHVLKAHRRFDYLVGARVPGFSDSVQLSDAPVIVLEGDEYPASAVERRPKIHFYKPHISVLSGIAWDHVNVFPTYENYLEQFRIYLRGMEAGAELIYNREDAEVVKLVETHGQHLKLTAYGTPRYHYDDGTAVLDTEVGEVRLQLFGSHNLLNSEAARAVCKSLGITDEEFNRGIADFTGAARRLEKLFQRKGIVSFRDFAHAPSKLKATLDAVREAYPDHALVALFELHTYSSLSDKFSGRICGKHACS